MLCYIGWTPNVNLVANINNLVKNSIMANVNLMANKGSLNG